MSKIEYLTVKNYVNDLVEIEDMEKLKIIYEIVKRHECKLTITSKWILCCIDHLHQECIREILEIKNAYPNTDLMCHCSQLKV